MTTTDGRSLELLVALLRQQAEQQQEQQATPDPRRRTGGWLALAAFSVALIVPIVLVAVAIAPKLPATGPTIPSPAGATFSGTSRPTSPAASPRPARTVPAPPMSPAQLALTRSELADLAAHLPTGIKLTAPAGWARWGGAAPASARRDTSCPQIFGWIGSRLGSQWTYAYGALPQGSCSWVPVPYVPEQPRTDRFVVSIGFEQGDLPALLGRTTSCAGGAVEPQMAVPTVAEGAVLTGCDDGVWPSFELRIPDAGGTGVWFLSSVSGTNQHTYAPTQGVLAALDGATHAYG